VGAQGTPARVDSSAEHGWDLRKTHRGDNIHSYFVKQAHVVTGGHRKEGKRRGGRTPMQLLADAVETYRVEDLTRWWIYEAVAEGRHQLEWSRGGRSLRTLAALGTSQTDEQVAEETLDGEHRLGLPPETTHWLRTNGQHPALLDAAEHGGIEAAREWLGRRLLTWGDSPRPRTPEGHSPRAFVQSRVLLAEAAPSWREPAPGLGPRGGSA
jgi:hypothetical protein